MVHFDPAWFEAAGTGIVAAETGVAMWNKKKAAENAATAPAAPAPINVTVNGITGQDLLIAIAILALAILAAALIVHHGLALAA
jgi:hypothetical protein